MKCFSELAALAALALLITGCSAEASNADEVGAGSDTNRRVTIELKFSFDGRGVLLSEEQGVLPFGTPMAEFLAATEDEFGAPASIETNEECGAGPLEIAHYPNQKFTISFRDGAFVGWMNNEVSDDFLSMRRNWLVREPNFTMIEGSSLGEEFSYGPKGESIHGLFKDASRNPAVISTWSGTNCIFR